MKRLLQINVEANYGSTGRIASDIGDLVISEGWESHIAYGRIKKDTPSSTYKIAKTPSIYNHVLQTRLLDRHGLASTQDTKRLIAFIQELKPSLVHMHNLHGYYLNYEKLFHYLKTVDIPLVWTLHDCWALTGHCTHYEDIGCYKWQKSCHSCPQKKEYPTSWMADRSAKNHQLKKEVFGQQENLNIVTVSNWLNRQVGQSYLKNHNTVTIYNGIDTSIFKPRKNRFLLKRYDLFGKFIILGVASVWSEKKGLADFISLSKGLKKDEVIVLIGLNKEQIKTLPDNIIGLERTSSLSELVSWYSIASVYLNASVEESFGMTTAEALACGTPVIVYDATACPEMVIPEIVKVVAKRDINGIRSAINEIKVGFNIENHNRCRNHVVSNFDKNDRYKEYFRLYKGLLYPSRKQKKTVHER